MLIGLLALITAALFAGAALYINLVEQPARLALDDAALLTEWKPAYKRGTMMQAPLALAGFVFGAIAWWQSRDGLWIAGALLMLANWPVTYFAIMPTNRRLTALDRANTVGEARALVERWGLLHGIRTALSAAAVAVFALALA
jgi:uncharacterized membrane protein